MGAWIKGDFPNFGGVALFNVLLGEEENVVHVLTKAVPAVLSASLLFGSLGTVATAATVPPATSAALHATISRSNYGINVFSYDNQLNAPSTIPGLTQLGLGMQQFPNANEWSWTTNSFRSGGHAPVSLGDWGHILQATHNQGLFIFNYDENPTFTGGGTPADARQLTQYIVAHHLPISAIVIGSEEYGSWDHYANLNPSFSPQYYAHQSALIAQAIHAVDPLMKVGISFTLGQGPHSLLWDQTVLRTDGPYINFVSIHDYPNQQTLSNPALLSNLPGQIRNAMNFVQGEIAANVPPAYARRIQTWVTEFNPYGQPGPQSLEPVYGAAMVESAMLWRALGASKLFIWSYDGQAHVATPSWPVATNANKPYGLFALAGDGQAPELPINTLYPSGKALSQYMKAIGSGAQLSVWVTTNAVIGQVSTPAATHVFAINTSNQAQSLPLSASSPTLPPATMTMIANQFVLSQHLTVEPSSAANPVAYQPMIPQFQIPATAYPGETFTLTGSGFGTPGSHARVIISENGVNYGAHGDAYHVQVQSWSPTQIRFVIPNGISGPPLAPGTATLSVETANRVLSLPSSLAITPPPVLNASIGSLRHVYPGENIVVTGTDFGSSPGSGYVLIQQNHINYGAPSDAYKVHILHWTNTQIQLQIPNGTSGPALVSGPASMRIVSNSGLHSANVPLAVVPVPHLIAQLASSQPIEPGQRITVVGTNFGSSQGRGFIQVSQGSVNYGAPGDWYPLVIQHWSNSSVTFMAPTNSEPIDGHYEPNLNPGTATVTLVNTDGLKTQPLTITAN